MRNREFIGKVVLRGNFVCPCNACDDKINKVLVNFEGVKSHSLDIDQGIVTAVGKFDLDELIMELEKTKKVKVVPPIRKAEKGLRKSRGQLNNQFKNIDIGESSKSGGGGKGKKTVKFDLPKAEFDASDDDDCDVDEDEEPNHRHEVHGHGRMNSKGWNKKGKEKIGDKKGGGKRCSSCSINKGIRISDESNSGNGSRVEYDSSEDDTAPLLTRRSNRSKCNGGHGHEISEVINSTGEDEIMEVINGNKDMGRLGQMGAMGSYSMGAGIQGMVWPNNSYYQYQQQQEYMMGMNMNMMMMGMGQERANWNRMYPPAGMYASANPRPPARP